LPSESESSSEFVALAEDRGYSSVLKSEASDAFFRSTPSALVANSLPDSDSGGGALGHSGYRFSVDIFVLDIYEGGSLVLFSEVRRQWACLFYRLVVLFVLLVRN